MESSSVQSLKILLVSLIGVSKDALHLHIGLGIFIGTYALSSRRLRAAWLPWLLVLVAALGGELLDRRDDIASLGHWRWKASLHDILNTMFWPTVLSLVLRTRSQPKARSTKGIDTPD